MSVAARSQEIQAESTLSQLTEISKQTRDHYLRMLGLGTINGSIITGCLTIQQNLIDVRNAKIRLGVSIFRTTDGISHILTTRSRKGKEVLRLVTDEYEQNTLAAQYNMDGYPNSQSASIEIGADGSARFDGQEKVIGAFSELVRLIFEGLDENSPGYSAEFADPAKDLATRITLH